MIIHLETFADNLTLFASSYEEMQTMITDLIAALKEIKMRWTEGEEDETGRQWDPKLWRGENS